MRETTTQQLFETIADKSYPKKRGIKTYKLPMGDGTLHSTCVFGHMTRRPTMKTMEFVSPYVPLFRIMHATPQGYLQKRKGAMALVGHEER